MHLEWGDGKLTNQILAWKFGLGKSSGKSSSKSSGKKSSGTIYEYEKACVIFTLFKTSKYIYVLNILHAYLAIQVHLQYFYLHRWREVKFLGYKYFGILTKDNEEENEAEMKYDAFFCYRYIL